MAKKKPWTRYLVPGFVFQSVVIGGGYGTGAEIMQYFGVNGLVGGLLARLDIKPRAAGIYVSLVGAMLCGRLVAGALNALRRLD